MIDKKRIFKLLILLVVFIIILILLNTLKNNMAKTPSLESLDDDNTLTDIQYIVSSLYEEDYPEPSFMPQRIDYAQKGLKKVFFVNGYLLNRDLGQSGYIENDNYLIVTNGIYYAIDKIEEKDIDKYEKEYFENHRIEDIIINNDNTLPSINYSDNYKLSLYINNFNDLSIFDKEKAFNLLTKDSKNSYGSVENFNNNNIISSNIKDVKIEKKGTKNTYKITDYDDHKITIIENKILDYQIEIN